MLEAGDDAVGRRPVRVPSRRPDKAILFFVEYDGDGPPPGVSRVNNYCPFGSSKIYPLAQGEEQDFGLGELAEKALIYELLPLDLAPHAASIMVCPGQNDEGLVFRPHDLHGVLMALSVVVSWFFHLHLAHFLKFRARVVILLTPA